MTSCGWHLRALVALAMAALAAGCSTVGMSSDKIDYASVAPQRTLEVPPDLSQLPRDDRFAVPTTRSTTTATASATAAAAASPAQARPGAVSAVAPAVSTARIEREGSQRWLAVNVAPEQAFATVREFLPTIGLQVEREDAKVGIIETTWAENRAKLPQDIIRRTLGRFLDQIYSTGEMDKYRVRIERTAANTAEIYISHRGMEEVMQGGSQSETGTVWRPRPSDPELEVEMLKRLMVFMGTDAERAAAQAAQQPADQRAARAQLVVNAAGESALIVDDGFSRAWREVGLALDRVGFTVEDRDRTGGVYFVRYNDPLKDEKKKGIMSKLAFWSDDDPKLAEQYRIVLIAKGDKTHVTVQNAQGQSEASSTGKRILTLVQEQMK